MPILKAKTTLPSRVYQRRRWFSLIIIILAGLALFEAYDSGCIEFSRNGIEECVDTEPFGFWSSVFLVIGIIVILIGVFLSTFGKQTPELEHQEQENLADWAAQLKPTEEINQTARFSLPAKLLSIAVIIFILFILIRFGAFRDLIRFSMFALLLIPFGIGMSMLIQWLGEAIKINDKGIFRYRVLLGWQHWSWDELTTVKLDGDFFEKNYSIKLFAESRRIIFTPSSFHQNKQQFTQACQWILQQAILKQVAIRLPPDGLDQWLEGIYKN